jgi:hypothetical protein
MQLIRPLVVLFINVAVMVTEKINIAIPVTGHVGPKGCETLKLPHISRQSAHRRR